METPKPTTDVGLFETMLVKAEKVLVKQHGEIEALKAENARDRAEITTLRKAIHTLYKNQQILEARIEKHDNYVRAPEVQDANHPADSEQRGEDGTPDNLTTDKRAAENATKPSPVLNTNTGTAFVKKSEPAVKQIEKAEAVEVTKVETPPALATASKADTSAGSFDYAAYVEQMVNKAVSDERKVSGGGSGSTELHLQTLKNLQKAQAVKP